MNLRDQLKREEGCVPYAYKDSLGYLTIGVGRLIDKNKGGGLRPAEIDFLLDNDIAEKTAQVIGAIPWFPQLNEPRQAVLVGMCFQLGLAGLLGFANTLAAVRDGHFDHAAEMLLQSRWATQTPERARRMSRQLATGEWQ
jgi:lysozyme